MAEEARRQQVKELIGKAAVYIRFREYKKAIDACERILKLEPDHKVARFWLQDSRRLVYNDFTELLVVDRETGAARPILSVRPDGVAARLAPTPDNTRIYFARQMADADVWLLSLE